jgi:enamine deaminase RidA (YjgF/YER057c/UK114 family)
MARRSIHVEGYSHANPIPVASRVGNIVASSVISAVDPASGETPESFEGQCEIVFSNMRLILEAAGATPEDVVKVGFYMPDPSQRTVMNRFWLELFPDEASRPARHTQQDALPPPRLIAADFIAVIDD